MSDVSRGLQEIWEIEDRLYEETKGMDLATYMQFVRKRVDKFLQSKGYKITPAGKREFKFLKEE